VGVPVGKAADAYVYQYPFGGHRVYNPQGVVEAASATEAAAHGISASPGYVVAEHRKKSRVYLTVVGHSHPHSDAAVIHGRIFWFNAATYYAPLKIVRNRAHIYPLGKHRTVQGVGGFGRSSPHSRFSYVSTTERGESRNNFSSFDSPRYPGLGGFMSDRREFYLKVKFIAGLSVGNELSGNPNQRAFCCGFKHSHGRCQPGTAEEIAVAGTFILGEREYPMILVIAPLKTVIKVGVALHRLMMPSSRVFATLCTLFLNCHTLRS
jgi:hypothetical protein